MTAFRKNTNLIQIIVTNTIRNNQNFSHLHKQQPQVNVPHVTPVHLQQQHLQALKPERPFFTKSFAIVTVSSTY